MSNTYYDMTGVLRLDAVTPVIKALFGPFALDESHPGHGEVYIATISESNSPTWDDIQESLVELAESLSVSLLDQAGNPADSIQEVLRHLAAHFGAEGNASLMNFIETAKFFSHEDDADLDDLVMIAKAFDDGHGLMGYKIEGGWHCDRPRLFEFGGFGAFGGQHALLNGSSTDFCMLGENLERAIKQHDEPEVCGLLHRWLNRGLDGVRSTTLRQRIAPRIALAMLGEAAEFSATDPVIDRLLSSESYVADDAVPVIAEEAAEAIRKLQNALKATQVALSQALQYQVESAQFVEQVAALSIWDYDQDDGSPYQECERPSDGFLDSHTCLMGLIQEARTKMTKSIRDVTLSADVDSSETRA